MFDSLKEIVSGNCFSAYKFRENFGKLCLTFANTGQHDASEFLTRLLVLGNSHFTDLFETIVSKKKTCLECNKTASMTTDEAVIFRVSCMTSDLQTLIDSKFEVQHFLEDGLENINCIEMRNIRK